MDIIGIFLQSRGFYGGYYGGAIGNLLSAWEQAGVFSYMLPFLLIFSLVFGILTQVNLFKNNRAINAILALAIGLMSLQFDFVPRFFAEIFPRLGVALGIILVILVLTLLFLNPTDKFQVYAIWGVGAVAALAVIALSAQATGFGYGSYLPFLSYYWQEIFYVALFVAIIAIVVAASKPKSTTDLGKIPFVQALTS